MNGAGEPTLTHALLAKALGVTVTTIKSYRRKFPEFFRTASLGKPIRFPADTLALCRRIHHHFKRGLSVEETRKHLAQEFEPVAPAPEKAHAPQAAPEPGKASLERVEDLLEGLFDLQNRTHSLMTELLAKLDTVADRLGPPQPTPGQTVRASRPAPSVPPEFGTTASGRIQRAIDDAAQSAPVWSRKAAPAAPENTGPGTVGTPGAAQTARNATSGLPGRMAAPARPDAATGASPAQAAHSVAGTRAGREDSPAQGVAVNGPRPPAEFLNMPVVVHSANGDFLGVTSPTGRPFTLEQFEAFLVLRAQDEGGISSAWVRQGQQWTLRLEGSHAGQDEASEHHFLQAVTPRGNTVARFASLSVNGKPASDADLQAFLRQVKDSLAS
jgi:hypothetical protein